MTTIHVHLSAPPDEYGPRKGLEAISVEVCECGHERRSGTFVRERRNR